MKWMNETIWSEWWHEGCKQCKPNGQASRDDIHSACNSMKLNEGEWRNAVRSEWAMNFNWFNFIQLKEWRQSMKLTRMKRREWWIQFRFFIQLKEWNTKWMNHEWSRPSHSMKFIQWNKINEINLIELNWTECNVYYNSTIVEIKYIIITVY